MSAEEDLICSLLRPEVIGLKAYHVPDSAGLVKLDAMENPYSWPPEMVDKWLVRLSQCQPNRYPDPSSAKLKLIIRDCNGIEDSSDLLLGNGSDELIQILLMSVAGNNTSVLAPQPTFVMYQQIALCLGIRFIGVSLNQIDFSLDMNAMRDSISREQPAIIFLAYPNNPTGNLFSENAILEILKIAPGLVVLDEAYAPFAGTTFLKKLSSFDNLLVMRTVSKLGLAGLRLGYLAGPKTWIEQLDKLRLPYNINSLTQISVEFAFSQYSVFEAQTRQICKDRALLFEELSAIESLTVYPSHANFILFRLVHNNADEIFNSLKNSGVLIKNMSKADAVLSNCLRVTVGTPQENKLFVESVKNALIE